MNLDAIVFYALAALTGVCAVGVVVSQNIVRAAAWLLFALAGTAGIFFLLHADFLGATQLLVRSGGLSGRADNQFRKSSPHCGRGSEAPVKTSVNRSKYVCSSPSSRSGES